VLITNSVAIDGRFGENADVLGVLSWGFLEGKNPKTLFGGKKKECVKMSEIPSSFR
jgi:hypothetical protein